MGPRRRHLDRTRAGVVPGLVLAACLAVVACDVGPFSSDGASDDPSATEGMLDAEGEVGATGQPLPAPSPPSLHPSVDDYPAGRVLVDRGDGTELLDVAVRIAETSEQRRHGLMEVPEVPDGVGMWFVYDEDHTGGFWMKGTQTDLDIAWVDDAGRIVAIDTMEVCPGDPCPSYEPGAAYRTALEVRAGWFADNDVEVGDRVLRDHQS